MIFSGEWHKIPNPVKAFLLKATVFFVAWKAVYLSRLRDRLITPLLTEPRHRFDELAAIRCPVLVMAGEKDVIREEHTRQIAAHIPQSQLVIFPGGTHYEPVEHPDVFNKAVLDFLAAPGPPVPQ